MKNLKIKIFSDGANIDEMKDMNANKLISGLTTNPTLMRKSGITNYLEFVENVLDFVIEKYKLKTRDAKADQAKELIEPYDIKYNSESEDENRYLVTQFDIDVNGIKARSEFIFKLGSKEIISSELILY